MVSKSSPRTTTNSTNQAFDQRVFHTDNSFTRVGDNIDDSYNTTYEDSFNTTNEIDSSINDSYNTTNEIDQSVSDSYNTTNEIDNSIEIGDGGIYAAGNVTVTDGGAIEAALNFAGSFAEDFTEKATEVQETAIREAFKSTVGGITEQSQTTLKNVLFAGAAIAALGIGAAIFSARASG